VLQVAPPQLLYDEPASLEVARFVGSPPMNVLPASVEHDGVLVVATQRLPFRAPRAQGALTLGVRPEALVLCAVGGGIPASVARIERLGAESILHATVPGAPCPVLARLAPDQAEVLRPGQHVGLAPLRATLFGDDGQRVANAIEIREHAFG
jgi:multiple sugar transport system ATP-binding protein